MSNNSLLQSHGNTSLTLTTICTYNVIIFIAIIQYFLAHTDPMVLGNVQLSF